METNTKKQVSSEIMAEMRKELEYLKKTKRREIAEQLRQAISFGDLKENAAYHEAKDAQAFLEGKISELDQAIKNSIVVNVNHRSSNVSLGSRVRVIIDQEEQEYWIVNGRDSQPLDGKISADSPIGKALLNKSKGDKFLTETPSGDKISIEILEIKNGDK
jgi:transcription elongation factor GreA